MNPFFKHLAKGYGGGFCIGIGGTAFLCIENPLIGAMVFSVGIFSIYFYGLDLYTGKVGYLVSRPPRYLLDEVLASWLGNFAGAVTVSLLLSRTSRAAALADRAAGITAAKLSASFISQFIMAVFCGLMVFFLVDMHRRFKDKCLPAAVFYTLLCVVAFLVCGFEHSIADMYFFTAANRLADGLPAILLISLGNLIGGCLEPAAQNLCSNFRLSLAEK